ncbi:MAG TPA: TonB family protein [Candidatus Obscuribacterales bacterium]
MEDGRGNRAPRPSLDQRLGGRRRLAGAAIAASSLVWIGGLLMQAPGSGVLPWCITLAASGAIALAATGRSRSVPLALVRAGETRPLTFVESYALTYIALSFVLCLGIIAHLLSPAPRIIKPQIVDIELTSLADFRKQDSLLPSTEERTTLRKRTSPDQAAVQGSLAAPPASARTARDRRPDSRSPRHATKAAILARHSQIETREARAASPDAPSQLAAPVRRQEEFNVLVPPPAVSRRTALDVPSRTEAADAPFMEEVAPPELVELVDNDGDDGKDVWQPGGRSSGGRGARSELAAYLKELNKRIKRSWEPPRGISRTAEIFFRVRRQGTLALLRLVRSSGDPEADEAALRAVAAALPFRALPPEYSASYLDVKYTFNYLADGLTEVPVGQTY